MQKLVKNDEEIVGKNVKKIREHLNLLQRQLAKAIGTTSNTIRAIEQGKGFKSIHILGISHFFAISLSDLLTPNFSLPDDVILRSRILAYHKRHRSTSANILNNPPTTKFLIEVRLLDQGYFNRKRSVEEIKEKLRNEYSLRFKTSSSISQALREAVNAGLLQKEAKDNRSFYYFTSIIKGKRAGNNSGNSLIEL